MKYKFWIDLLISAAVAFVPMAVVNPLNASGFSDFCGLLVMGALVMGWPGCQVARTSVSYDPFSCFAAP